MYKLHSYEDMNDGEVFILRDLLQCNNNALMCNFDLDMMLNYVTSIDCIAAS